MTDQALREMLGRKKDELREWKVTESLKYANSNSLVTIRQEDVQEISEIGQMKRKH